jgi:Ca2+-binding EF-hand superfamily protein
MRTVRAVGIGLALFLLPGGAVIARAQNAGPINFQELFLQLDANGDRVIDRGEVPDSGRAAFETLLKNGDTNKDGRLDQDEYRSLLSALRDAAGSLSSRFAELDKNGDGKLSRDEFAGPPGLFGRLDADGDGTISKDEAARAPAGPGGALFADRIRAMDKNGDGKVSRDEFIGPPQLFDRLDTNKDGAIGPEDRPGGPDGVPGAGAAGGMPRFPALDKNGDGKLGKDEFEGPPRLFDRLDANSDGYLTPAELGAMGRALPKGKAAERRPEPTDN